MLIIDKFTNINSFS